MAESINGIAPESGGDIFCFAIMVSVEALVGINGIETAMSGTVVAQLDVLEQVEMNRHLASSRVPGYLEVGDLVQVLCNFLNLFLTAVSPHDAETGDGVAIFVQNRLYLLFGELCADVIPKVRTMASGAAVRASGNVDGKSYFVRDLLENNVVIVVFHSSVPFSIFP